MRPDGEDEDVEVLAPAGQVDDEWGRLPVAARSDAHGDAVGLGEPNPPPWPRLATEHDDREAGLQLSHQEPWLYLGDQIF